MAFGDVDQAEESRQAKALRDQGAAAVKAHDFAGALDSFERAYALRPSTNMLFNIAAALDRLDRPARAAAAFEEFLATAVDPPAVARQFAEARLEALEPRVARLALIVSPGDATVTIDGQQAQLRPGRALPLLPGERIVVATREGYRAARQTVALTAGEKRELELTLEPIPAAAKPVPAPAATAPATPPAPPPAPSRADVAAPRRWQRLRQAGFAVGAVGLASLVVGAGMASLATSTADMVNHPRAGMMYDPSLERRGDTAQALAISFFTIGGAATVAGVTMLAIGTRRRPHAR